MRVNVLFFGVLKDLVGSAEDTLEIAPGSTLESVFESYAERFATLRGKRPSILFARNREFSRPETMLCDNDEVAFLPPVSGGSDLADTLRKRYLAERYLAERYFRDYAGPDRFPGACPPVAAAGRWSVRDFRG